MAYEKYADVPLPDAPAKILTLEKPVGVVSPKLERAYSFRPPAGMVSVKECVLHRGKESFKPHSYHSVSVCSSLTAEKISRENCLNVNCHRNYEFCC